MNFPSKVTPYNLSVFPLMTLILSEVKAAPKTPSELLASKRLKGRFVQDVIDSLDALFALGKIDFDESGTRLCHVA